MCICYSPIVASSFVWFFSTTFQTQITRKTFLGYNYLLTDLLNNYTRVRVDVPIGPLYAQL